MPFELRHLPDASGILQLRVGLRRPVPSGLRGPRVSGLSGPSSDDVPRLPARRHAWNQQLRDVRAGQIRRAVFCVPWRRRDSLQPARHLRQRHLRHRHLFVHPGVRGHRMPIQRCRNLQRSRHGELFRRVHLQRRLCRRILRQLRHPLRGLPQLRARQCDLRRRFRGMTAFRGFMPSPLALPAFVRAFNPIRLFVAPVRGGVARLSRERIPKTSNPAASVRT